MYCVYLTEYHGNKLPRYYVGSSSVNNVESGYKGSVSSKEFGSIWKDELLNNSHLFVTRILSTHNSRKEALEEELRYQIENDVVNSVDYINKSLCRINGFFGMNVSGENNPMYGKVRCGETHYGGDNISNSLKRFYETERGKNKRRQMSTVMLGESNPMYGKEHDDEYKTKMKMRMAGEKNPMYGKRHSDDAKEKMRKSKLGENNPACKLRKKYLANDTIVENANQFCADNGLSYTNFIKYADSGKVYKGFLITRIMK